jgi:hypothetical protein
MVKRGTKKPQKLAKSDRFPLIEKALRKRTKTDLIQLLLTIARDHAIVARELEAQLDVEKPLDDRFYAERCEEPNHATKSKRLNKRRRP